MKPENSIPHDNTDGFMDTIRGRDSVNAWFTAKECAEIARAYAEAVRNPQYTNANPITNRELIQTDKSEWEAKFTEWEKL